MMCMGAAMGQAVHKWVDAQGKTHYGNQPPQDQTTSQIGSSKSSTTTSVPPGSKPIPKDVQELGGTMVKELQNLDKRSVALNCNAASANTIEQIDSMIAVAQKNYNDGYLKQSQLDSGLPALRALRSTISTADCSSATGNKQAFYQCMSNDRNHVAGCGKANRYPS